MPVHLRIPAEVAGVDVQYTGSRHGRWRRRLEVTDLKEQTHRRSE